MQMIAAVFARIFSQIRIQEEKNILLCENT